MKNVQNSWVSSIQQIKLEGSEDGIIDQMKVPLDFKIQTNVGKMVMPPDLFSAYTKQLMDIYKIDFFQGKFTNYTFSCNDD